MNIYLVGTQVSLAIPLADRDGNTIAVDSVDYRVINQAETELVPRTNLATYVADSDTATVIVPGVTNQFSDLTALREIRIVELYAVTAAGTIVLRMPYGLELSDPLVSGINSFQSYSMAQLVSMSIPSIPNWDAAFDEDRMAALIGARDHILRLNFSQLNTSVMWGQDSLNFIPEGVYVVPFVGSGFLLNGSLAWMSKTQFDNLPDRFRGKLKQAQVVEADAILGGDPTGDRRKSGLIMEQVGETKQMYRSSRPIVMPICDRALGYLSEYTTMSKLIGRR